jgi:ribosomal protein S16
MIKIKLLPRGKKHQITYRIVVAEARSKSDGKFIADLGFYTPQTKTLEINKESMADWQKKGAQLTQGIDKLLNPDKYPKKKKAKKEKTEKTETTNNKPVESKAEEVKTEEVKPKETKTEDSTPSEEVKSEENKSE